MPRLRFFAPCVGVAGHPRADSFDARVEARFRPPSGERMAPSPDSRLPALPPCASSAPRPIRLPASAASGSDWPSGTSRVGCGKPASPTSYRHAVACAAPWSPANAPHDCARPWGAVTATPATKPQGGNFSNGPPTPASCGRAPFPNWPACASPRRVAPRPRPRGFARPNPHRCSRRCNTRQPNHPRSRKFSVCRPRPGCAARFRRTPANSRSLQRGCASSDGARRRPIPLRSPATGKRPQRPGRSTPVSAMRRVRRPGPPPDDGPRNSGLGWRNLSPGPDAGPLFCRPRSRPDPSFRPMKRRPPATGFARS